MSARCCIQQQYNSKDKAQLVVPIAHEGCQPVLVCSCQSRNVQSCSPAKDCGLRGLSPGTALVPMCSTTSSCKCASAILQKATPSTHPLHVACTPCALHHAAIHQRNTTTLQGTDIRQSVASHCNTCQAVLTTEQHDCYTTRGMYVVYTAFLQTRTHHLDSKQKSTTISQQLATWHKHRDVTAAAMTSQPWPCGRAGTQPGQAML